MKAIDIALLLPHDIQYYVQQVNHSQPKNERQYTYSDTWPYPHISLYMASMSDDEIQDMREVIVQSWIVDQAIDICTIGLNNYERQDGTRYYIDIQKSDQLVTIQQQVLELWKEYLGRPIDKTMYIDSDEVSENSMWYCENYKTVAAWESFHPHLSLGKWKPVYEVNDFECECTRLVIGHMWPSGTLRNILYEFKLW